MNDEQQLPQDEETPETVATSRDETDEGPDVEGHRILLADPSAAARSLAREPK
jgi:hypothetical protein